jgi:hypothetical protein
MREFGAFAYGTRSPSDTYRGQRPNIKEVPTMNVVIVRHTVADYDTWKAGYDAHEPVRRAAGCTSVSVSREPTADDGATDVTIAMQFPDATAAERFLGDPGLPAAMQAAGVVGIPDIRVTELVDSADYRTAQA